MFFSLDLHNGVPLYEQVVRQIKFAVANGALRSGDLTPSVRELAKQLTLNPNTVARAYRQLQDEGVVTPVRGSGLAVTADAVTRCKADRKTLCRQTFRQAIDAARQSGLADDDIEKMAQEELTRKK